MTASIGSMPVSPSAVPQASPTQSDAIKRVEMMQRRETMMLDKLMRDAQPPKSRTEAITRSAMDSLGFDVAISALFTAGLAAYKGLMAKEKSWKWVLGWGLGTIPVSMLFRAVTAAFTGKAHGQEASQRILASMGMNPNGTPVASQTQPVPSSTMSSPLVNNTAPIVPQTLNKPSSTLTVSA